MAQIDTIETVLERCRFLSSERELDRTNKHVREALPPFSTVSVRETPGARSFLAYPVVPSPKLTELLVHFLADEVQGALERGPRSAPFTQQDLEQFREEAYFAELAELLAKTRAHGTVLRLDSVFWIHLSYLVANLLHADDDFVRWLRELCPGVRDEALQTMGRLSPTEKGDRQRAAELRRSALRSLITRNEYANRTVSRMVGDERPNVLHTAMASNQLVFSLPPGFPTSFDLQALVVAKDYGLPASRLGDLITALRALLEDLYRHREDQALSGTERFFYSQFYRTAMLDHARKLDVARLPGGAEASFDSPEDSLTYKLGWTLVFHDDVLRYLLSHLDQLNLKRAITPKLRGQLSREVLELIERPERLRKREGKILELARDLRLLDLFDTLRDFQALVQGDRGSFTLDGKQLRSSATPLDLASYYELYRRNRTGVAVFIDLIGFTAKTRDLFFGGESSSTTEDVEVRDRGELAALALERLFHVRQELQEFGGSAEGFEGDAILDIFPDPLAALRYVARFAENYGDYARIQFRPFSRAVPNPFATEGFRVGIASGEYTLVNVPDMDASGTLQVRLRTIGPTINKASRLNSGKKASDELFLSAGTEEGEAKTPDPLGIFRVHVEKEMLDNAGICLDRTTFNELRDQVRRARLPHWLPHGRSSFELEGRDAEPKAYRFHLIVHDPAGGSVFAVRRLPAVPKLKGLSQTESVVYEALLFAEPEYLEFLKRDGELPPSDWAVPPQGEDSVDRPVAETPPTPLDADLSQSLPDYLFRQPSGGQDEISASVSVSSASADSFSSGGDGDALGLALEGDDHVSLDEEEGSASDIDVFGSLELADVFGSSEAVEPVSQDGESISTPAPSEDSAPASAGGVAEGLMDRADVFYSDFEEELSADREERSDQHGDYLEEFLARTGEGLPGEPDPVLVPSEDGEESVLENAAGDAFDLGGDEPSELSEMSEFDSLPEADEPAEADEPSEQSEPSEIDEDEDAVVFSIEEPIETSEDLGDGAVAWPEGPDRDERTGDPLFLDSFDELSADEPSAEATPAPSPPQLPEMRPPTPPESPSVERSLEAGPSLLGVLGDDLPDRISTALGKPYPHGGRRTPHIASERSVDAPDPDRGEHLRVPAPELSMALAEYNMVVRMLDHETEVWIGRLSREVLFDLHRYRLPTTTGHGVDLAGVLERFLRDKVREDFLAFGTRYAGLPVDGSEPVTLPVDEAQRILVGFMGG